MGLFSKAVVAGLLALLLNWAYGPGYPATSEEFESAYSGKRVVICGASYGIGADIAYEFAKAKAKVVIAARSKSKLDAVAQRCRELGASEVHVIPADFNTMAGSKALVAAAKEALKGIDVLVLNHVIGIYEDWPARLMRGHEGGTLDQELEHANQMMAVNAMSFMYLSSYALPDLAASQGRVIVVGSGTGRIGFPRVAPYSATKHAVFGYFDSLRQDLVASTDEALRSVSITTGILGSFDTETARDGTAGQLDHMDWRPPSEAAVALLKAGARRWRDVYTPWEQTRIITLLHPWAPTALDWVVRKMTGL